MIHRLSIAWWIVLLSSVLARAELTKEMPIAQNRAGTAITVAIATSAWTIANTATSLVSQRATFVVTNPSANSYKIYGICHATTPSEAITVLINEVAPGANREFPCGPGLNLYLLSLTAAQNIAVWEVGQ